MGTPRAGLLHKSEINLNKRFTASLIYYIIMERSGVENFKVIYAEGIVDWSARPKCVHYTGSFRLDRKRNYELNYVRPERNDLGGESTTSNVEHRELCIVLDSNDSVLLSMAWSESYREWEIIECNVDFDEP